MVGYKFDRIGGSVTTDADGIYASNCGSGGIWHGPTFYMQLPSTIGMSGQYWHIVFSYTAQNPSGSMLHIGLRVGFSHEYVYEDGWAN